MADNVDNDRIKSEKNKIIPKNKITFFSSHKGFLDNDLDKSYLFSFPNPLVRIEYPGHVKNVSKAIKTLGGIQDIQRSVEGKSKLELNFHPNSKYSKGCVADKIFNMGILIKITKPNDCSDYSYEIVNVANVSFKFNRMSDFQYLPLVAKETPENEHSEVEYLHDKIIPNHIPTLEWLTRKETSELPPLLISPKFARFDLPQVKFQTNSSRDFIALVRPEGIAFPDIKKKGRPDRRVLSFRVSFIKPDVTIPIQPLPAAVEIVQDRHLNNHLAVIQELFQKKPIWRKISIMHKTGMSNDTIRVLLPCVSYYCSGGPWRLCWIKFDYNPLNDFNSRIYQILDFRIRSKEGLHLKVERKRGFLAKLFRDTPNDTVSEKDYVIRPNIIPPARQMLYQYCDVLIPEVQDMLAKLPKLPPSAKFDIRNGWLPLSFTEHCREIVNKYVLDAVQNKIMAGKEPNPGSSERAVESSDSIVSLYCSKLLSNIRKGVTTRDSSTENEESIEEISLIEDETVETIDTNEVVNSLPERILEESDEEDSDMDLDMEAIEEINEMLN
ncbi:general transcription factor 3C polypeptide 5 [Sitophilus oryzae]|uniref:General transcription factor 3C polypeptide 5 n=1 Tax=Sitophilus oryzae TaxID=7048 RepID=A0A6J2Y2D6_SITOR|nr:general transcription factor 3C polypeptide 5 [Sitophilus oryzae]